MARQIGPKDQYQARLNRLRAIVRELDGGTIADAGEIQRLRAEAGEIERELDALGKAETAARAAAAKARAATRADAEAEFRAADALRQRREWATANLPRLIDGKRAEIATHEREADRARRALAQFERELAAVLAA